jgi:hypothetical protein
VERALEEQRLHDLGYRWTWPPLIADLSPRQRRRARMMDQAKAYVRHEREQQADTDEGLMDYDHDAARRDWLDESAGPAAEDGGGR